MKAQYSILLDRALIHIDGEDAEHFLQNLITTDLTQIAPYELYPGALLTPQGKVLFDFLVGRQQNKFLIDIATSQAAALVKRLTLYKLRAKVEISLINQDVVKVCWHEKSATSLSHRMFTDKRFDDALNIKRCYFLPPNMHHTHYDIDYSVGRKGWDQLRISCGIAEGEHDFASGDVFAHDINYDQLKGLSFTKGCYIGQEVVSRMHHRKTARRRILIAESRSDLPAAGTAIEADGKPIGTLGSVVDNKGLALVRIDRAKVAMDNQHPITANDIKLSFAIPPNVTFSFPDNTTKKQ